MEAVNTLKKLQEELRVLKGQDAEKSSAVVQAEVDVSAATAESQV